MPENSRRSAHATIRGYLYQTCLGVLRWLDLQPNEVLVCEGDEDLDRYLLNGEVVFEQVKDYSGGLSLSDKAVLESLGNFLRTYVALRQQGEDRKFVFTTTAYQKTQRKAGLNFDLLEEWKKGTRTPDVLAAVQSLLEPKEKENDKRREEVLEARAWLDSQPEGWKGFMDAVDWTFEAPDLDAIRRKVKDRLAILEDTQLLPAETFLERLVTHVFQASSRPDPADRTLTRRSLSDLLDAAQTDLGNWAATPRAARIRAVFDEVDRIHRLLQDGTAKLPPNAPPGKLLTAAYEVISFDQDGRREELDFLRGWCDSDERRSVLLLTGEGGSGKTRLMIEWCRHLRHQGWHAGFLGRDRNASELDLLLEGLAPRLIVMDYTETRLSVLEPFLLKMGMVAEGEGAKFRLVLLARRKGDWWNNLPQAGREVEDLLLRSPEPREITPLIPRDAAERERAFHAAVEGFSEQLHSKTTSALHIPNLMKKDFARVLYLHMAALAYLRGERIESAEDALRQTLAHERLFWRNQVADLKMADRSLATLVNKALESAVTAVTLVGGPATPQQAEALVGRVLKNMVLGSHHPVTILGLLLDLYAGSGAEDGHYIDPLQPDLLGEELVAENLVQDQSLLGRVLEACSPEEASFVLVVLLRLVRRVPKAEEWIGTFVKELGSKASQEVWGTLQQLCEEDEYQKSVPLREIAQIATAERLKLFLERSEELSEAEQSEYSRLLSNHGVRLSALGRREDALKATQEAVEIRRRLAQDRPDAFTPDLASSLNNLGNRYSDLGRREDALKATQEAVRNLSPFFLRLPAAFASWMTTMVRNYLKHSEATGQELDEALLDPIREALQALSTDRP